MPSYLKPSVAFRLLEQLGCSVEDGSIQVHSDSTPSLFEALRSLGFPVHDGKTLQISRGAVAANFSEQQVAAERLSQGKLHGLVEKSEISDPPLPPRAQVRPASVTLPRRPPREISVSPISVPSVPAPAPAPAPVPRAPVDVDALVSRLTADTRKKVDESEIRKIIEEVSQTQVEKFRSPRIQTELCSALAKPRRRVQPEISVVALEAARWGGMGCRRTGFVPRKFVAHKTVPEISDHQPPVVKTRSIPQQVETCKRLAVPRRSPENPVPPQAAIQTARSSAYVARLLPPPPVDASRQRASVARLSSGLNPFMRARLAELQAETAALFRPETSDAASDAAKQPPRPEPHHAPQPAAEPQPQTTAVERALEEVVWLGVSGSKIYEELDKWLAETSEILLEDVRVADGARAKQSSVGRLTGERSREFFEHLRVEDDEKTLERLKVLRDAVLMKISQLESRSRARELLSSAILVQTDAKEEEKVKRKSRAKMSFWAM